MGYEMIDPARFLAVCVGILLLYLLAFLMWLTHTHDPERAIRRWMRDVQRWRKETHLTSADVWVIRFSCDALTVAVGLAAMVTG